MRCKNPSSAQDALHKKREQMNCCILYLASQMSSAPEPVETSRGGAGVVGDVARVSMAEIILNDAELVAGERLLDGKAIL